MSRHEPFSPRRRRDALDRQLDTAATPRAPADLAARIAREVPRFAQVAPLAGDSASSATQQPNSPPLLRRRAVRGWILAAGMGALAAGTASIIIGTPASAPPPGLPQAAPLAATKLAPQMVSAPVPREAMRITDAPVMPPQSATTARLARSPVRAAAQSPILPARSLPARPLPARPLAPDTASPEALAAMPSPAGPTGVAASPTMPPRGQMGPVLPQGYGYSGGGGGGLPSGAPVKMSGGPSGN